MESELNWQLINEDISLIIRRFVKKETLTIKKKKGYAHISIWTSGAIVITGVTSRKEAELHYKQTVDDIKKLCGKVFKKEVKSEKDTRNHN